MQQQFTKNAVACLQSIMLRNCH